jgi:hypothetical protein
MVITLDGDQLTAQATHQPKLPLYAESPTKFFLKQWMLKWSFPKMLTATLNLWPSTRVGAR